MTGYTEEQMEAWGKYNLMVGFAAMTLVHVIMLILTIPPLDLFWHATLLLILGVLTNIHRQEYLDTKETEE